MSFSIYKNYRRYTLIQLNEKQMAAKDAILKFIYDPNETAIILTGGAGTKQP